MRKQPVAPLLLAASLAACANDRTPLAPQADAAAVSQASLAAGPGCTSVAGSAYGKHVRSPEPAWVGTLLVSLGGGPVERATFITRNNEIDVDRLLQGQPFRGQETWTLTLSHGSFDIVADFVGSPASTPGLHDLSESGDIGNGTGGFAGASGHVTIHGPFVSPVVDPAPLFIGQLRGSLCGIG